MQSVYPMKNPLVKSLSQACLVGGVMAVSSQIDLARAQSSDALLEVLVRKGILTEQEAKDVRADLAKQNDTRYNVRAAGKTTMGIDLFGDFRGRYDGIFPNESTFVDRQRLRYRLRAGATVSFFENFEVGLRLASGEKKTAASGEAVDATGSGDPISRNQSFANNGAGKELWIDLAYGMWKTDPNNADYAGSVTFGKMKNPFVFSPMVFDADYTPEGAATSWKYNLNADHSLSLHTGGFVLDELEDDSNDPYLLGMQLRHDAVWAYNKAHKPKIATSIGVAGLLIDNNNYLPANVPNVNVGNTTGGNGQLRNFNPIVVDGKFTYTLDKAPLYHGAFPITVGGEFMHNPGAHDDNQGYSLGITLGKTGAKGTWSIGYEYRFLEADAWWEELVDSDFGAFYPTALPDDGYAAGTNVRGHIVTIAYSPWNALTLSVNYAFSSLIDEPHAGVAVDDEGSRFLVDAMIKF